MVGKSLSFTLILELSYTPVSYAHVANKHTFRTKHHTLAPNYTRKVSKRLVSSFTSTTSYNATSESLAYEVENKKHDLLRAVQETKRGLNTTPDQRSIIEDALVTVEGYGAGESIDLDKLDGTWRLQYTSAPDVVVLFEAAERFPFLEVGQIFQKFECKNKSEKAVVRNVIRWSIRNLLEEQEGATLVVSAKFSVVSQRNIFLQFEEITLQDIKISEELQAIIAPAILPRSFLNLQILQFIRAFKAEVPVTSTNTEGRSVGGLYYLSYLDNNMLLGRAVGGGGVFVFTRAQPLVF